MLTPNAAVVPAASITSAAPSGPSTRPRLNVTDWSASAVASWRRTTSDVTNAIMAGVANALVIPSPTAKTITTGVVACPVAAATVRPVLRSTAASWLVTITCRRSNRSATVPVHGARRSTDENCAKKTTPRATVDSVSR